MIKTEKSKILFGTFLDAMLAYIDIQDAAKPITKCRGQPACVCDLFKWGYEVRRF